MVTGVPGARQENHAEQNQERMRPPAVAGPGAAALVAILHDYKVLIADTDFGAGLQNASLPRGQRLAVDQHTGAGLQIVNGKAVRSEPDQTMTAGELGIVIE